jgi:hypothetical protein
MDNIAEYIEADRKLNQAHRNNLENEIRDLLSALSDKESVPLDSPDCEGDAINTLTYADAINEVFNDGSCVIYNNYECEDLESANHDGNVYGLPLKVTVQVLMCIREYTDEKAKNKQERAISLKLEEIAKQFDEVQNMSENSFGRNCKLFNDISDIRSEIENVKDRISEDLATYIKKQR